MINYNDPAYFLASSSLLFVPPLSMFPSSVSDSTPSSSLSVLLSAASWVNVALAGNAPPARRALPPPPCKVSSCMSRAEPAGETTGKQKHVKNLKRKQAHDKFKRTVRVPGSEQHRNTLLVHHLKTPTKARKWVIGKATTDESDTNQSKS